MHGIIINCKIVELFLLSLDEGGNVKFVKTNVRKLLNYILGKRTL